MFDKMIELEDKLKVKKYLLAAGICFILYPLMEIGYAFSVHYLWKTNLYLVTHIPTKLCYIIGVVFTLLVVIKLGKSKNKNSELLLYAKILLSILIAFFTLLFIILTPLGLHQDNYFLFLAPNPVGGFVHFMYPTGVETFFPLIFIEGLAFTMIYHITNRIEVKKSNRIIAFQGWNKPIFFSIFVIISNAIPLKVDLGAARNITHFILNIIFIVFSTLIPILLGILMIIRSKKINSRLSSQI